MKRYYETPEQMQEAIDKYFAECDSKSEPYTVTGLALGLGFTSRLALLNYEGRPNFVNTVKKAKLRVEEGYEKRLSGNSPTGAIFALKNFNWRDKQETEISGPNGSPVSVRSIHQVSTEELYRIATQSTGSGEGAIEAEEIDKLSR